MHLTWAQQASHQLADIQTYLEVNASIAIAEQQIERIFAATEHLLVFPEMGRQGRIAATRELIVRGTPYLLVYQISADSVFVLALLHGAQRWPTSLRTL